jgi:hypothetical protein
MNKDNVLKQIEDKLLPTVKNLENGNASEHDIFPSLLWLLLENSKELEKSGEITKGELLEYIGNLKQVSAEDVNTIVTQENQKTLSLLKWLIGHSKDIEKSADITKDVLLEHIGNLKQVLQEEVKTVVTQENQKTLSLLKWVIGFCVVQFLGLGALAAIILMR